MALNSAAGKGCRKSIYQDQPYFSAQGQNMNTCFFSDQKQTEKQMAHILTLVKQEGPPNI